jgi:dienelactone hydrolase
MSTPRTRILIAAIAATFVFALRPAASAEGPPSHDNIADTPGTGRFPALKEETAALPNHVVYRPARLDALGTTKLGVYIFGNGGCTDDAASARLHLLEIASHGYLAIAPGRIRTGPGTTFPMPPPTVPPAAAGAAPLTFPPPPTKAVDLTSALDWALAQNKDPKSPYFHKIDPKAVAVSGYSCGGLQALQVAVDPRVKTLVMMNSGIFNAGTPSPIPGLDLKKSMLETLHTPVLYVLGGEKDIAYPNGMDDFARISHVPVFVGNILNATHAGTYWQPNGGKAAAAVVSWLDWQLRHDAHAAKTFVGKACGLCVDPAWVVQKKMIP